MQKVLLNSLLISILLLANTCSSMYTASSPVVKLTKDNFKKLVLDSDQLWFVEFYAPWCGHCKQLAPTWEKIASQLKGVVNVGAVDMTTDQEAGQPYGIQGFPSIKFFGFNKNKPTDYQSGRDEASLISYVLDKVGSEVRKRSSGDSGSEKKKEKKASGSGASTDADVIVLTADTFDEKVLGSKDIWLVEFYAPWCGHCKKLEPEWNEAATKLRGQVKLGKVDATVETVLAQRFGVKGYPTIKVFDYGLEKSDSRARDYPGGRDMASITAFANELLDKADVQPEVYEITKQVVYGQNCIGQVICILTFLPNIYDSNSNERNAYLDVIMSVAKKNRKYPFVFMWLQAGDQLDIEREWNLGFGFPAVVGISPKQSKISTMKGAFDEEKLSLFLSDLISGRVALDDLKQKPTFKKVDAWDGKDAAPLEEEEDESSLSEDL